MVTHDPHTYKTQFRGQSVQNIEWKQTDGQMDTTSWFTFTANAISISSAMKIV